jgi:hypothetical protein
MAKCDCMSFPKIFRFRVSVVVHVCYPVTGTLKLLLLRSADFLLRPIN